MCGKFHTLQMVLIWVLYFNTNKEVQLVEYPQVKEKTGVDAVHESCLQRSIMNIVICKKNEYVIDD